MSNLIKPTNNGGPAFPLNNFTYPDGQIEIGFNGMSLRDYFAAKALQAVAHNPHDYFTGEQSMAIYCYRMADAMLKAREGKS